MPCKITNEDTLHLPYLIFIRYYHARLVINRHLYGPTHGVSINKFNKRAKSVQDLFGVTITMSHHASIVDDNLLVSSIMLMSHEVTQLHFDAASMNGLNQSAHMLACENRTRPASLPLSFLNSKQVHPAPSDVAKEHAAHVRSA
jgi:hypothetical protein